MAHSQYASIKSLIRLVFIQKLKMRFCKNDKSAFFMATNQDLHPVLQNIYTTNYVTAQDA